MFKKTIGLCACINPTKATNTANRAGTKLIALAALTLASAHCAWSVETTSNLRADALSALKKSTAYYHDKVATHGGYNYFYSLDLSQRWGEGVVNDEQISVEPPGTPAVGMAYLKAYEATGDTQFLEAAKDAGTAMIYGQLQSGGWTQKIDFNPDGSNIALYRNGKGKGRNFSSLDDNQTQVAIQFLSHLDKALGFKNTQIHEATMFAIDSLLKAQFPNGGFPQAWDKPATPYPVLKARYPENWSRIWPHEPYHLYYTLNDGLADTVSTALLTVIDVYHDKRYTQSLARLGDFLILAQMPDPQPAWAQQYSFSMEPTWARKFEPPAITGWESQDVIRTLMKVYRVTKDPKYLAPIPKALAYLKKSQLPDGRMNRYYELQTNKPLYMNRKPGVGGSSSAPGYYYFTYDDTNLPSHYGWKQPSFLKELEQEYEDTKAGKVTAQTAVEPSPAELETKARQIVQEMDDQGRWVSTYNGERLTGQPKFETGFQFLDMQRFNANIETLSHYLAPAKTKTTWFKSYHQ